MRKRLISLGVTLLVLLIWISQLQAQQFRVWTTVIPMTDEPRPGAADPEPVARSLTLFEAGRVFDYLPPPVGEVTIFEPAHQRFVIFNGPGRTATSVTFDEIGRHLQSARDEVTSYARRLDERNGPSARRLTDPLRFQLAPQFTEQFDSKELVLQLASPGFTYRVNCAAGEEIRAVEAYLNYTDWAARLNHILHPGSLYPAPRLRLNDSLRTQRLLPVRVELRVNFDPPYHLQARHEFGWQLKSMDRDFIHTWESQLNARDLKWVSLRDYQAAQLQARK